jgi:PAS domain S-box-containing protein
LWRKQSPRFIEKIPRTLFLAKQTHSIDGWQEDVPMTDKPSYEELAQKVRDLEREATLLKAAKRTGEESEEAYRLVVESAPDGIGIIQDGMVQFSNPSLNDFLGFSRKGLKDRPFFELIHPDDRERVSEYYHKRLNGEEVPSGYSFKAFDRNGAVKWIVSVHRFPVQGSRLRAKETTATRFEPGTRPFWQYASVRWPVPWFAATNADQFMAHRSPNRDGRKRETTLNP